MIIKNMLEKSPLMAGLCDILSNNLYTVFRRNLARKRKAVKIRIANSRLGSILINISNHAANLSLIKINHFSIRDNI
jgi:predicted DNA binding CopG/RHH family protein